MQVSPGLSRGERGAVSAVALFACALVALAQDQGSAQRLAQSEAWSIVKEHSDATLAGPALVRPTNGQALALNLDAMRALLDAAPREDAPAYREKSIVLALPTPGGGFEHFEVFESPVMEPPLAARYPMIRTYAGRGLSTPTQTVRIDLSPAGFRAQVLGPGGFLIDPVTQGDVTHYMSYAPEDAGEVPEFRCLTTSVGWSSRNDAPIWPGDESGTTVALRSFSLAISTTGEYGAFQGGTVAQTLASVVTVVNRVTGIYERDLGVRLVLAANTDQLLFTSASTDPYAAPGANPTTMNIAQQLFSSVLGDANYDVGHVFHRGPNSGIAGGIGITCQTPTGDGASGKGRGVSVVDPPVGDLFAVNFVAHELGHQFGARHTFNNCTGGPGDDPQIAHEPASGSTIMGYAGLCGSNNLQVQSDAMFAANNVSQIRSFVIETSLGCAEVIQTSNQAPVVDAGPDHTIPARTPFELRPVSASDPDGDALTFSWEQQDGGPAVNLPLLDMGTNPLFRVWSPSTNSLRTLPRLSNLLAGTLPAGETLPTTSRVMNWRLMARDNRPNGGTTGFDDVTISTIDVGAGFAVTSPSASVAWTGGSPQPIAWNVAGTTMTPIDVTAVRIVFSADGGLTWPVVLAESTPNDGFESVIAPILNTSQGRVRVEAVGNIFFNVNQGAITVIAPPVPVTLELSHAPMASDIRGNGNGNGVVESGENVIDLSVPVRNVGQTSAIDLACTLSSLTPTVNVTADTALYMDAPGFGGVATGATPFVLSIAPEHPCGQSIQLLATFTSAGNAPIVLPITLPTGTPGGPGQRVRYVYSGLPVAIPDNLQAGGSATITISGTSGPIVDADFSFDGTTCSSSAGSTTVGLQHGFMGDLAMTLRSPAGTLIPLSTRRGGWGNNMCNTVFDDAAALAISSITATGNPWSNTYRPEQPLAAFNGQSAEGVWTLRVVDNVAGEAGWIRGFSVWLRTLTPPTCEPPAPPCDSIDFNNDGSLFDPQDIEAFMSLYSEGPCVPEGASCNDVDFNNDGSSFDPLDIEVFLRVFSQGPC